jgi:hypothetical protein
MTATIEQFVTHASKFGLDLVYETASENGFSERELSRLRHELQEIASRRATRRRRARHGR